MLITAKEMKKISEENYKSEDQKVLEFILKNIKKQAERGLFSETINMEKEKYTKELKYSLEKLGYEVNILYKFKEYGTKIDFFEIEISWD